MRRKSEKTNSLARCDGCDDLQADVRPFRVRLAGREGIVTAHYCPGCAELALAGWNEAILMIAPAA